MADLTYVDVRFSKTEREPSTSQECLEGVTYADLSLIPQPRDAAQPMPPVCSLLTKALGALVVLLLAVVIALTLLRPRCSSLIPLKTEKTSASEASLSLEICPNSGFIFERTSLSMEGLKDHLCEELNESMCVICPHNWMSFRGRCYFISEELKSWTSSEEYCISRQSHLVLLDDESEMNFIEAKGTSRSFVWIGLHFNESSSEWTWLNGSTLRKGSIHMKAGEPGAICGSYSKREIYPLKCNNTLKWICEKKAIQFDKRCFGFSQLSKDQF